MIVFPQKNVNQAREMYKELLGRALERDEATMRDLA
jgi:hypothetical protein